jgi:1-acyl-sn-glycerol-3-phosphate acyltransferase
LSKKENKSKKRNPRGSVIFRIVRVLLARIVGLIFRIKVVNKHNEPAEGGYIVCANHISATDPIMLCYAFKKHQIRFMAKKELFRIPVLAQLIRMLGAFPVDRGGGDVGAIKNAVSIVESGCCMGIFPQGHRYRGVDPRSTPTKNGAALISVRASAPVVPVYIWRKGKKGGAFRRTYVVIGEPIPFESFGYDKEVTGEYNRITSVIFDRICNLGEDFEASLPEKMKK